MVDDAATIAGGPMGQAAKAPDYRADQSMANRIDAFDWSATPLGARHAWPQSLETAVCIMLAARQPAGIFWGSDLICLFNDAYAEAVGPEKAGAILGLPAGDAWPESLSRFEPAVRGVLMGGGVSWRQKERLPVYHDGRLQDVYWSYSYGPIPDTDAPGGVGGVMMLVSESTPTAETLRESEERLLLAIDSARLGTFNWDLVADSTDMDERMAELLNGAADSAPSLREAVAAAVDAGGLEQFDKAVAAAMDPDGDRRLRAEIRIVDGQGEERWIAINGQVLFDHHAHRAARVMGMGRDISDRKRAELGLRESERRHAFLLTFSDALRSLDDPVRIQTEGARLLGEFLGADRVNYAEIIADTTVTLVHGDYCRDGMPSLVGRHPYGKFGEMSAAILKAGRTLVMNDIETYEHADDADRAFCAKGNVRARVAAPLIKGGGLVAVLAVHQATPRRWTASEVTVIEDAAQRIWGMVERARAETALSESELRYKTLFNSIDQGFCIVEVMFDDGGHAYDYVFLEVNAAFRQQTGLDDVIGRSVRTLVPELEDFWAELYGRVVLTRRPERVEHPARQLDKYYEVYAFPVGDPEDCRVGILFNDIKERKEAEEHRALLNRELNHRVHNTIALIQAVARQTLKRDEVPSPVLEAFEGRLAALAGAHGLLTRASWTETSLRAVIEDAIESCGQDPARFTTDGPSVWLRPQQGLFFGLALHELCTNAIKYGALSVDTGHVSIEWQLDHTGRLPLTVVWREQGGPPVKPPTRRGFGSRLVEQGLAHELNAEVEMAFHPEGFVCTVRAPV